MSIRKSSTAKSAQARSYVASGITADVNGMTIPARFAELLDRLTSLTSGHAGPVARNPAPDRSIHHPDQRALTRAGVNYADTEQANASMFVVRVRAASPNPTRRQVADRAAKVPAVTPPARFAEAANIY